MDSSFADHKDFCARWKLLRQHMSHTQGRSHHLPWFCIHTKSRQSLGILLRCFCAIICSKYIFQPARLDAREDLSKIADRRISFPDDAIHVEDKGFDVRGYHFKHDPQNAGKGGRNEHEENEGKTFESFVSFVLIHLLNFLTKYLSTGLSIHLASRSARSSKFSLPINSLKAARKSLPFFK